MQQRYYEILVQLAEIAEEHGSNTYSITSCAFGAISFKNGENKANEVGTSFMEVSRCYWTRQRAISIINRRLHHENIQHRTIRKKRETVVSHTRRNSLHMQTVFCAFAIAHSENVNVRVQQSEELTITQDREEEE